MIRIDREFHALIPPLSAEERTQLEANLKADGCRDPLVVWDGILLDGHNRHEICTKHGITFKTVERKCKDRDDARMWIFQNQLGRRNLTDYSRGLLVLQNETLVAQIAADVQRVKQAEAAKLTAHRLGKVTTLAQHVGKTTKHTRSTNAQLGSAAGLSDESIRRIKILDREAPASTKAALRAGTTTINREYQKLKAVARPPVDEADLHAQRVQALLNLLPDARKICNRDPKLARLAENLDKWIVRLRKEK